MALNFQANSTPQGTIIWDTEGKAVLKVVAAYATATGAANTIVLQANTLKGANAATGAMPTIIEAVGVEFAVSTNNATVSLEYVSSNPANASNATIWVWGDGATAGHLDGWIQNPLINNRNTNMPGNATGDIQMNVGPMAPGDSFTLIITLVKDNQLACWANLQGAYGTGYPYN